MKKYFLLAAVIAAVDQALKAMICFYPEGRVIWSIPPLFELYRTTNTGAAFSMMSSKTVVVAVISSVLMLALCVLLARSRSRSRVFCVSLSVLLGGGIGNLIDRVIWGGVTDYIRLLFIRFPVFNFADVCVVMGAAMLIYYVLIEEPKKKKKAAAAVEEQGN